MLANVNLILSALLMSSAVSANYQGRNAESISNVIRAVDRADNKFVNAIRNPSEAGAVDPAGKQRSGSLGLTEASSPASLLRAI